MVTSYKHHIYPSFIHAVDVLIVIIIYFCLAHIYMSSYEPRALMMPSTVQKFVGAIGLHSV